MKKLVFVFAFFLCLAISAQDNYYTMYSFVVEPQNEATVYKLVEDYYSKNKPEGIYVRLFENHFKAEDMKATHSIVFLGTQEAVGNMYAGGGNVNFDLFITKLNQYIKDGAGSAMGKHIALNGDTSTRYPFQVYLLLDVADPDKYDAEHQKFHSKHNPPGMLVNMGNVIAGQGTGHYNRWAILGYKDMKSALGGPNQLLSGPALAARQKAWDAYRASNGGVEVVGSGMRVLLGAW
ncbi:hypothetical protein [Muriicola sp.]|uniref:hypothetical protein n=1 Tax=Muriicola sp. TaxID=2020856 RepID=UPI003566E6E7